MDTVSFMQKRKTSTKTALDIPFLAQESIDVRCIHRFEAGVFPLKVLVVLQVLFCGIAHAEGTFNPYFLSNDPVSVADLTRFDKGLTVPPGTYRVDIYVNDVYFTTRDVNFNVNLAGTALVPCLSHRQLSAMGVNIKGIPSSSMLEEEKCGLLVSSIKEASALLDVERQRLNISVPQAFMRNTVRGYIPPDEWDNGITAGRLNYSLNGGNARGNGFDSDNYYLNLQSGFNLGAWRLRDNTTWSYNSGGRYSSGLNKWQHVNTYLQRSISKVDGLLTIGDSYTPSEVFDSVNFRGVQLASDDNMLPDSQRGFAPMVRGIAKSTARVSVLQNGYEIYQSTVQPGPFVINDLYPSGSSGDLQVTVKEGDGSIHNFAVPYSSVPLLQRDGRLKFGMTVGEFRSGGNQRETPMFLQSTALFGTGAGYTLYGGAQLASDYKAFNTGFGKNLGGWGALSLDVTHSQSNLPDNSVHHGQSLRVHYSKALNELGTNLKLVGYRYSTAGFYTLSEATYKRMSGYTIITQDGPLEITPKLTDYYNLYHTKRGRLQMTLSQAVGRTASVYFSGSRQSYWNTSDTDDQAQVGYSASASDINYNLSYSLSRNAVQKNEDQMVAFNVSIPFSHWLTAETRSVLKGASATYGASSDVKGRMNNMVGMAGTLLADSRLSYTMQQSYDTRGVGMTTNIGGNYRGGYAATNVGYSRNANLSQFYYGIQGGVLAHEDGVTFSQPMGDTTVLIKAPGAEGVSVENSIGVRTDWRGYGVVPYVSDFRENRIVLNPNSLANNVDLDDPVTSLVPTRGAVVRANFATKIGLRVLMTLMHKGKPLPFGATVTSDDGKTSSIVSDGGQVYLTGLPLNGLLKAKWGEGERDQCIASYALSATSQQQALSYANVVCE